MITDPIPVLRDAPWSRILRLARRGLESSGGELSGTLTVRAPTEPERKLIIGLTGAHRPPGVGSVSLPLAALDTALTREFGLTLADAVVAVSGPLRNRPAERAQDVAARDAALAQARRRAGPLQRQAWFDRWLDQLAVDGTVTRLVRRGDAGHLTQAVDVLNLLPAQGISIPGTSLPVLAERATGNTKALSGTPVAALVLRALALADDVPAPVTAAQRRTRWEAAGVIVDDLASQVLVLGVRPLEDHAVASWLRDAADRGIPFRLTLHQLTLAPVTLTSPRVFVCENPAVLRAAVADWNPGRPPLICTEGVPAAACHRLLAGAAGTVTWRGDFDWTGLRTTADAIGRYGAQPWRMSADDYRRGLAAAEAETEPLRGAQTGSPWDPALAPLMASTGRAVMEERLLPVLLADLAG
jgi:uncharacterized protein (TIGR02679 family)